MNYRKKPIVIQAFQLNHDIEPAWFTSRNDYKRIKAGIEIHTLEGDMLARPGDYIIKGIKDELYPCNANIFESTYEWVTEEAI